MTRQKKAAKFVNKYEKPSKTPSTVDLQKDQTRRPTFLPHPCPSRLNTLINEEKGIRERVERMTEDNAPRDVKGKMEVNIPENLWEIIQPAEKP